MQFLGVGVKGSDFGAILKTCSLPVETMYLYHSNVKQSIFLKNVQNSGVAPPFSEMHLIGSLKQRFGVMLNPRSL